MFSTMQLTFRAWTRICWLYWWTHFEPQRLKWWKYPIKSSVRMKSCRHEILDWQTITDSTTQQKYAVQRFVTHCNSFTHADVKKQQVWAISSVIVSEVQWHRTGLSKRAQKIWSWCLSLFFFFAQQFHHVILLHTCTPAKCYWQKLKLCGLKACPYRWFSCNRAPQVPALHHILLSCTCTNKRSIQSDNLSDSALSLPVTSSCAPPTAWRISQQPPIPDCAGKRTAG